MTIGIYKLNFKSTNKVYIGQSCNIEKRFSEHIRNFKNNTAPDKLQNAYKIFGKPALEILIECTSIELKELENLAIEGFNSVINGFNTLTEAGSPNLSGINSPHSKLTEEVYINIFKDLVYSNTSIIELCKKYNTTYHIIQHISNGKTHLWLKDSYPEDYKILETKIGKRYNSKWITNIVISPEGKEYVVDRVSDFEKQHKLFKGCISRILTGQRKTSKGWQLKN